MSCKSNKCNDSNPCNKCQQEIVTPSCDLCDFLLPTKCVTVSTAVPCLNIEAGETLQDALSKLCIDGDFTGIEDVSINNDGELIIDLTNGQTINAGVVVGADGEDGTNGTNGTNGEDGLGISSVTYNSTTGLTITYTDATSETFPIFDRKFLITDEETDTEDVLGTDLTTSFRKTGDVRYNKDTGNFQIWDGSSWVTEFRIGSHLIKNFSDKSLPTNINSQSGSSVSQTILSDEINATTLALLQVGDSLRVNLVGKVNKSFVDEFTSVVAQTNTGLEISIEDDTNRIDDNNFYEDFEELFTVNAYKIHPMKTIPGYIGDGSPIDFKFEVIITKNSAINFTFTITNYKTYKITEAQRISILMNSVAQSYFNVVEKTMTRNFNSNISNDINIILKYVTQNDNLDAVTSAFTIVDYNIEKLTKI